MLWDEKETRIVNNESSEIIRMLNREFDPLARRSLADLYPEKLRREIDWLNERIYRTVNNGVYRAGFATAQDKYEEAVTELFSTLDWLEKRMKKRKWLCGSAFTEADVRLFTTLVRFDAVYYSSLQVQPAAAGRLSEPVALDAPRVRAAGRGEDRRHEADQGALLPQHEADQSHANRAQRAVAGLSLALAFLHLRSTPPVTCWMAYRRPARPAIGFTWRSRPLALSRLEPRFRLLPQLLYDSRYFYLQSDRIGLKLENERGALRAFPAPRLEGFASDDVPESMVGMAQALRRATTSASPGATSSAPVSCTAKRCRT